LELIRVPELRTLQVLLPISDSQVETSCGEGQHDGKRNVATADDAS